MITDVVSKGKGADYWIWTCREEAALPFIVSFPPMTIRCISRNIGELTPLTLAVTQTHCWSDWIAGSDQIGLLLSPEPEASSPAKRWQHLIKTAAEGEAGTAHVTPVLMNPANTVTVATSGLESNELDDPFVTRVTWYSVTQLGFCSEEEVVYLVERYETQQRYWSKLMQED